MTPQQARELVNREQELYDAKMAAWNSWTDQNDWTAREHYFSAVGRWSRARNATRQAQRDYPHLFAPFAEVTK